MKVKARVYIVRHGETQENRSRIIQGQLDTSLNSLGLEQARLTSSALKDVPFGKAYTSDLRRASVTAEEILKHHPSVPLAKQTELREQFCGDLEGRVWDPKFEAAYATDGSSIEPRAAFVARAETWWLQSLLGALSTWPHRAEPYHVLVVSHGGFIGTLFNALRLSGRLQCATPGMMMGERMNASISIIELDQESKGMLVQYNDIRHLKDLAATVVQHNADEELQAKEQAG